MVRLHDHLPVDHRLSQVYRYGSALSGLVLLVFGVLGFLDDIPFFSTQGKHIAGLSSNGLLSAISIVVGVLLLVGARIGGNFASTLNVGIGTLFILSGLINLALLDTKANFLAFGLSNVFFSFVVGLMILTFGLYGRVGLYLPYDNPYWQSRHPAEAAARHQGASRGAVLAPQLSGARPPRPGRPAG